MKKILIVDDETDFCFFVKKNLEIAGDFQVSTCSDSSAALDRIKDLRPDLILMDFMMPGMTGVDVAEQLKKSPFTEKIPIVFLTSMATGEETGKRRNLVGGQCMLAKPVQIDELLRVIDTLIGVEEKEPEPEEEEP